MFDNLTIFNVQRVAREIDDAKDNTFDPRRIAWAIASGCATTAIANVSSFVETGIAIRLLRNAGIDMTGKTVSQGIAALVADTSARRRDLPNRKAREEMENLLGSLEAVEGSAEPTLNSLIGANASGDSTTAIEQVFRRSKSQFPLGGIYPIWNQYIDLESYGAQDAQIALFRMYLAIPKRENESEVNVSKWSMSVMDRSETYTFGDRFINYINAIRTRMTSSLVSSFKATPVCNAVKPIIKNAYTKAGEAYFTPPPN